jgi:peroxiredoxin
MTQENISVGQPAPDFTLLASTLPGPLTLSTLRGKIVVLAFYVLDFTNT